MNDHEVRQVRKLVDALAAVARESAGTPNGNKAGTSRAFPYGTVINVLQAKIHAALGKP
jgi:hypothetical protein